jgi:ATP-dependent RNA helicase RhlE
MSFHDLGIHARLLSTLDAKGITIPTPVQAEAIPPALDGRDLIAIAQTGTGKTLAFGLPTIHRMGPGKNGRNRVLVLTPTRELAVQVEEVLAPIGRAYGHHTVCIYGGVGIQGQAQKLRRGCAIIVATPGRLLDHINRGNIRFDDLETLILDEADRMLDMGFMPDIKRILSCLPDKRQTLFFSATFPKEIERLTSAFQKDPVRIEIQKASTPATAVRQGLYTVESGRKMELLSRVLREPSVGPVLVFLRTKYRTEHVANALDKAGFKAQAIHGGRSQSQRQRALDGFRDGRYTVLVATDVAARGIDVKGITHVVNYDIPNTADDYIHRIGRTARASAEGDAITFVSPEDHLALGLIERSLGGPIDRHEWEGSVPVISRQHGGGGGKGPRQQRPGGNRRFGQSRPRQQQASGPRGDGGDTRTDRPRHDGGGNGKQGQRGGNGGKGRFNRQGSARPARARS